MGIEEVVIIVVVVFFVVVIVVVFVVVVIIIIFVCKFKCDEIWSTEHLDVDCRLSGLELQSRQLLRPWGIGEF